MRRIPDEDEQREQTALWRKFYSAEGQRKANALFAGYNRKYFGGRLSHYTVEVWASLPAHLGNDRAGTCNRQQRKIFLSAAAFAFHMETLHGTLLHEMAHAAGFVGHGKKFVLEMQRLESLGAPVNAEDTVDPDFVRALERIAKKKGLIGTPRKPLPSR